MQKIISTLSDIDDLSQELCRYILKGEVVEVAIGQKVATKTLNQLGYLFGVVIKCIQNNERENGRYRTKEEIKEWLKYEFFAEEKIICGDFIRVPKSIADASEKEMRTLIEQVKCWCADNGIDVPDAI